MLAGELMFRNESSILDEYPGSKVANTALASQTSARGGQLDLQNNLLWRFWPTLQN
jgi:hypothetical protein